MSYDLIKRISIRKQTITSASNNVRPLYYETFKPLKEQVSEEKFIKYILVNFLDGNLQGRSKSLEKFNQTIAIYEAAYKEKAEEIFKRRWENYDYKTKTYRYTKEEIKAATEELLDILYSIYLKISLGYQWTSWKNIGWYKD